MAQFNWPLTISKRENKVIGNEPSELSEGYFKKYPIQVRLERVEKPDPPINTEEIKWSFTVIDQGIGISQEDLPYLMNVASSSTNVKRQTIIEEMPEWLQPSGTFGIGLQSVFMWTDEVRIKTKSIYTNEALDVTLHSPTGLRHGLVTVELAENSYLRPIGTELNFDFVSEKKPSNFSISEDQTITYQSYENYDRLLDEAWPVTAYKISDAVLKFSKHSPIEVNWLFKNVNEEFEVLGSALKKETEQGDFFSDTNSRFTVEFGATRERNLRYRGQNVKDAKQGLPSHYFFGYSLDLYAGKAGDWLTFNRNNVSSEGEEKISEIIARNLKLWVEKYENEQPVTDNKPLISALAKNWMIIRDGEDDWGYWSELTRKLPDDWLDLNCTVMTKDKAPETQTYRDILKKDMVLDWHCSSSNTTKYDPQFQQITLINEHNPALTHFSVQGWCKDPMHGIRYITANVRRFDSLIQRSLLLQLIEIKENGARLEIDNATLSFAIETSVKQADRNQRLLIPLILFPEDLKMERLILKEGLQFTGVQYVLEYFPELPTQHILLPYEIRASHRYGHESFIGLHRLDEFVKWVHSHLKTPLSLSETKKACDDLIDYIDNTVMTTSEHWKSLRKLGAIRDR